MQLVLKKLNSKFLTYVIKIISWVWNVILSSHPFSIMEKTQIITFSVILDILAAS
ncbi:uncharacterized protein METZ01_LOCUS349115 [marine metagenome]|uniref:Uncharacterized protein n=1 Tax=marine metagenome TaxID=408172 RepID=A0A382RI21_9ZZZZ